MTTEAPPESKRRLGFWSRALIGLALFVAGSFAALWLAGARSSSVGRSDLAEVLAETDRLDPRWRWAALDEDRPLMPNVGNSVPRARAAVEAKVGWGPKDLQTAAGDELLGQTPANVRLDAERVGLVRAAVEKQQAALRIALTLTELPRGRAPLYLTPDVIGTLLPHAQDSRDVAHLLQLESELLLHDGRAADVPDRVRAMLHGGAGLRDEPFLISQLVRLACRNVAARQAERALGLGELDDDACRRLAEGFAAERAENLLLAGLRGERAGMHVLFENLGSGAVRLSDFYHVVEGTRGHVPEVLVRGGAMLYSPRLYEDHANFLRWANRACALAALPPHEQAAGWATYDKEFKGFAADSRRTFHNMLTVLLMPAIHKVGEASRRDHATLGCVQAALAAERFRLANGRWPKALDELRPKFLREAPTDPFTGKPLLLATVEGGVVIYSTGKDGKDDGGKVLDVRGTAGTDLGVRLWDVNRRGLEPLHAPRHEGAATEGP